MIVAEGRAVDGTVLAIGADEQFRKAVGLLLMGAEVKMAPTANQTEGLGVDVVVIASDRPLEELGQVRVHPHLHSTPAVVVAPGRRISDDHPSIENAWVITSTGWPLLETLTERVSWLLARRQHPAGHAGRIRTAS